MHSNRYGPSITAMVDSVIATYPRRLAQGFFFTTENKVQ